MEVTAECLTSQHKVKTNGQPANNRRFPNVPSTIVCIVGYILKIELNRSAHRASPPH
jgi:hypothetical protein